jgi:hypothetical protein
MLAGPERIGSASRRFAEHDPTAQAILGRTRGASCAVPRSTCAGRSGHHRRMGLAPRRFGIASVRAVVLLLVGVAGVSCSSAHHSIVRQAATSSTVRVDFSRRPLHLPRLTPSAHCPATTGRSQPTSTLGVMLGNGPVRPVGVANGVLTYIAPSPAPQNPFRNSKWGGNKILWAVGPTVPGDVLIRGHQLDGSGGLRFGMGTTPDTELVLRASDVTADSAGWRGYPSETRVQRPGCYGYQIDTTSTSTIVVVLVERASTSR